MRARGCGRGLGLCWGDEGERRCGPGSGGAEGTGLRPKSRRCRSHRRRRGPTETDAAADAGKAEGGESGRRDRGPASRERQRRESLRARPSPRRMRTSPRPPLEGGKGRRPIGKRCLEPAHSVTVHSACAHAPGVRDGDAGEGRAGAAILGRWAPRRPDLSHRCECHTGTT